MGAVKDLEIRATDLGMEHGRNVAEEWLQSNVVDDRSPVSSALETLQGIQDSHTETLESLPSDNLSGEHANDYDTNDLASDLGIDRRVADIATLELFGELTTQYQDAFNQTAIETVESRCEEVAREGSE